MRFSRKRLCCLTPCPPRRRRGAGPRAHVPAPAEGPASSGERPGPGKLGPSDTSTRTCRGAVFRCVSAEDGRCLAWRAGRHGATLLLLARLRTRAWCVRRALPISVLRGENPAPLEQQAVERARSCPDSEGICHCHRCPCWRSKEGCCVKLDRN